ncbi:MAG: hypothetical protein HY326_04145, partial [Chloroflexi bacterium]|nr:hypothetical protein [Chloroflexota bacterium]
MNSKRRIFVDTRATRDFAGDMQWRWHTAQKHPDPVLQGAPDRPWEARG